MARLQFTRWAACGAILLAACAGLACATRGEQASAALDAYREGRYGDAELIWLEALSEAEAAGEDDPRLPQSLRMLANLYIHTGRFEEARPLLDRWLTHSEQHGKVSGADFASGLEAIAGVHLVSGELDEAIEFYQRALEVREG